MVARVWVGRAGPRSVESGLCVVERSLEIQIDLRALSGWREIRSVRAWGVDPALFGRHSPTARSEVGKALSGR